MSFSQRRWVMLTLYCAVSFINGVAFCALDPVDRLAEEYYGVGTSLVSLFAVSFGAMYLPLAPFASWGLGISYHWSMMISWIVTFIGCWLKYLAFTNYTLACIGIFLVASVNAPILAGCSPLAVRWFPRNEWVLCTSIASISNFVGMGASFIASPYLNDMDLINLWHAIFSTIFLVLNVIYSKNDPEFEKSTGLIEGFKKALKNKMIMWIVMCSSSGIAASYTVIAILLVILEPDGLSAKQVGWIGFDMVMMGMLGGLIATYLVANYNAITTPLRIFLVGSILSTILWACIRASFSLSISGAALHGATLIGHLPLGISAAVIEDRTIEESITTNMIFFMANLLCTIYTYPVQYYYEITDSTGLWAIAILVLVSFLPLIFIYRSPVEDKSSVKPSENLLQN
ncbi:unnamed protein product [Blepharisma stoltei]|uniref:Uncharacterized protein n=1 Tax=Blepharisma stoltei TaxID=1481888 RepID=A0AAU9J788_9CILI|nr:unnamed protein product [Blepharisma stoltei]